MLINKLLNLMKSNKQLLPSSIILALAILILVFARYLEIPFGKAMSVASYLTWHNLFEIASIVAFFAIFLITYYTYSQTKRLKTIIIGNLLLAAGIVDVFHMLSFKGMPAFFIENTGANRATTFWIASRFIFAIAFCIGGNIDDSIRSNVKRMYFLLPSLLVSVLVFVFATYYPSFLPAMYIEGKGLTPVKVFSEYLIMFMLFVSSVIYFRNGMKSRDRMILVLSFSLMISMLSEFAFTIYVNVYDIYNYIGHILGFIALFLAIRSTISRNVLEPFLALTAAQNELKEHADNQERTIEQRTRQLKMTNMKLLEDLEYARGIQKSMLPVFLPDTREISFNAVYLPTERISGDFYDIFKLDDRHMGFYISDVSGHGVPAAMLTVFLKQCIDNAVEADRHRNILSLPSEILHQIFDAFNHSNFKDEVYIVLIYCIYDLVEKKLVCSSAGLNSIPVLVDCSGSIREIDLKGFPICKLSGVCKAEFTDYEISVKNGDRLYLYTDGLPEARNLSGEQYSDARLKAFLIQQHKMKLFEQASWIAEDLVDFCTGKKMEDDITLLAVEFRE